MTSVERNQKIKAKIQIHNSAGGLETQIYLWTYELYLSNNFGDEFCRFE